MENHRVPVKSKKRTVPAITNPNKVGISISSLPTRHSMIGTLAPPVKERTPFPKTLQAKKAHRDASLARSYRRKLRWESQKSRNEAKNQVVPRNAGSERVTPSTCPRHSRSAPGARRLEKNRAARVDHGVTGTGNVSTPPHEPLRPGTGIAIAVVSK